MTNQGFFQTDVCAPVDPCFSRGSFFIDYCLEDLDGDGCIPYEPPGGPPPQECLPYACNRLEEAITLLAEDTVVSIGVSTAGDPPPYPLSETRPETWGHPDYFNAWTGWIASPNPVNSWNASSTYPGYADLTGVSWAEDLQKLQICDLNGVTQQANQVAHFLANGSVTAVTVPTRFLYSATDPNRQGDRKGSTTTALVTGYQGASLGSLNFTNNHAGRVVIYYTDGSNSGGFGDQLYAGFTGQGLDFGVFAAVSGQTPGIGSLDFGESLEGQWLYATLTEDAEFTVDALNSLVIITRTVRATMTRMDTGETISQTIVGTKEVPTGSKTVLEVRSVIDTRMYDGPYFFRGNNTGNKISWAFLSHGAATFDHETLHSAFKQSFVDYVPPDYCE
jgi:hypothetical protein